MNPSSLRDRMPRLVPGIAAGTSLGISDVLAKVVPAGGVDVVSMLSFRSLVGLAFVATWFRFGGRPATSPGRAHRLVDHRRDFCGSDFLFVQSDRNDRRADRGALLFHLSASDRHHSRVVWTRAVALQ